MPAFGKLWLVDQLLSPIVRPCTRLLISALAVPTFRKVRKQFTNKAWDEELEKDIEQWTRGAFLLLVATHNFEKWLQWFLSEKLDSWLSMEFNVHWNMSFSVTEETSLAGVLIAAGRLMVAIGVIESMPDQQLFSVIHPGIHGVPWDKKLGLRANLKAAVFPVLKGLACQHLSRSSPVFAILAVIFPGVIGWVCYLLAIIQYLIIGLVTSRDRALDVLSAFDRQMEIQRNKLIEEFHVQVTQKPDPCEELPKGV